MLSLCSVLTLLVEVLDTSYRDGFLKGFNELKFEVLSTLAELHLGTSHSVSSMVECSPEAAAMALLRYHRARRSGG